MSPSTNTPLDQRIEKLEKIVTDLQAQVAQLSAAIGQSGRVEPIDPIIEVAELAQTAVSPPPTPPSTKVEEAVEEEKRPFIPEHLLRSEFWLNKIGIGLVLFALIFLFSYAVEQGWLTPAVRVVIGLLVATTLLFFGLRLYGSRRAFSVVLLGGSMGSYYITGFAAFQLYDLVPYAFAFAFMVIVTLLTFFLSLRQDEAVLSLIGTFGGLLTPILLDTGSGNIEGLLLYSCLLTGGVVAIYFFRGWRILLWFVALGTWGIIFYSLGEANSRFNTFTVRPWILQFSIGFAWVVFWVIPLLRHLFVTLGVGSWQPLSLGFADKHLPDLIKRWLGIDLHGFTFTTALLTIFTLQATWDLTDEQRGWTFMGTAVIYAAAAFFLHRFSQLLNLSITHAFTSSILLMIGFLLILEDEPLFIGFVLIAVAWHFFSSRLRKIVVTVGTHFFSLIIGVWLLVRLFDIDAASADKTAVRLLTDLFVIGSFAGIAVAWLSITGKRIYLIAVHVAILLLLWRELNELNNGQALISIAWGVYAVALLIIGLRTNKNVVRIVGLVTLFVLVGKLFLVDLENVKAIWRILLFFGFGGLFLLLSYFYQGLWKSDEVVGASE